MTEDEKKEEIEKLKAYFRKDDPKSSDLQNSDSGSASSVSNLENINTDNNEVQNFEQNTEDTISENIEPNSKSDSNIFEQDNYNSDLDEQENKNDQNAEKELLEKKRASLNFSFGDDTLLKLEQEEQIIKKEKEEKPATLFSYAKILIYFTLVIALIVYILDQKVIPSLVHDRPVVSVPELEGLSLEEAETIISSSNLQYKIVKKQFDPKFKPGTVIMQKPEQGELVKETRPIYLTISKGSEKIKMPYLKGVSLREARIKLNNRSLAVGAIKYVFDEHIPKDSVISQSIKQGSNIEYGDKINLVVSKGSEFMAQVPNLLYKDYQQIDDILEEAGFKKGSITEIYNETYEDGTIIDQFPPPGEMANLVTYIDIFVAKRPSIEEDDNQENDDD